MGQTLLFEDSWEKAISSQDRQRLHRRFKQMHHEQMDGFCCTYLWHATNHRKALLVTVFLHNYKKESLEILPREVSLFEEGNKTAVCSFTLPFVVPSYTSMPRTFIFPAGAYREVNADSKFILEMEGKGV